MRGAALALVLAAAGGACAGPSGAGAPPIPPPAAPGPPLEEKAERFERGLDGRHLLPWGALGYRVRLPEGGAGPAIPVYGADTVAWSGALLAAECERWAATRDPAALGRVRTLLGGLGVLSAVTGERGHFARYACPAGFLRAEPRPEEWRDGGPGFEGWRWRADLSKDQVAGLVHGLAAVTDLVEDPGARARAARLLGDLSDRVLGGGGRVREADGSPTIYGDLSPRVAGLPVGVNAAIVLGLADAAGRATGEPRHGRRFDALVAGGAAEALRVPTVRLLGKEGFSNPNMAAMALSSILRGPAPDGETEPARARFRREAEGALRRILELHRGEGNAFWIAVAAPAGAGAGATARDLADARHQLLRFPLGLEVHPLDHSARTDLARCFWASRGGRAQFRRPLPVDLMGPGSFLWKSNPYEVVREDPEADGRTAYAGVDFLAAYWPLRRLGVVRE